MFEEIMHQMKVTFRQEAVELLEELNHALMALDAEPQNVDVINRVFRAMHTIKGSGAAAGFDQMAHCAHGIEDVFNQAREGHIKVTTPLVDSALLACDVLKLMLDSAADEAASLEEQSREILAALRAAAGMTENAAAAESSAEQAASTGVTKYKLVFRPKKELFYSGTDPVMLLDELRQLGQLELTAHFDDVPPLDEIDPELCYIWWTAVFSTSRPLAQVQNVFEFVQDDQQVEFEPIAPSSPTTAAVPASMPPAATPAPSDAGTAKAFESTAWQCLETIESCRVQLAGGDRQSRTWRSYLRAVQMLKSACEFCGKAELSTCLTLQVTMLEAILEDDGNCSEQTLEILAREQQTVTAALDRRQARKPPRETEPAKEKSESQASVPQTIRVDQVKLDRLMRAVGELLVARGAFPAISRKLADEHQLNGMAKEVRDAGSNLTRITDELQDTVMAMRMLPIKTTLQRFPRLIRDMSRSLGKTINLVIEGEETELDKAVIEQIGDALVHLVRNSADHGIEVPEERTRRGKPVEGVLKIRALNEGSQVVFQVSDDGKGLDPAFLRRKAVEKRVLTQEAADALNEQQSFELIFAPGFSTAEAVTDVSGRGVGMDVVRSNVQLLNGSISIASQVGVGTQFTIRLPTSLMVSKGILFRAGGEDYIVPMDSLVDMTKVLRSAIREYQGQRLAHVRGQVYTLVTMAELLACEDATENQVKSLQPEGVQEIPVAIVQSGSARYGIVVDRFIDQVEVIIKPMTGGLSQLSLFSGATIMGDGHIVLVVNPAEISRYAACAG